MHDIDSIVQAVAAEATRVCIGLDLDPARLDVRVTTAGTGRVRIAVADRSIPLGAIIDETFDLADPGDDPSGVVRSTICAEVARRRACSVEA